MKQILATVCVGMLAASFALAGGPVTAEIPASATWAAHVDVEAVKASTMGEGLLGLITAEGSPVPAEAAKKITKVWQRLGEVKSVTLYGTGFDPRGAVFVVKLAYNIEEIKQLAGITKDSATQMHNGHTIITFLDKGRPDAAGGRERFGCFYSDKAIVASAQLKSLQAALDLLDKPARNTTPLAGLMRPTEGSCLVGAAVGIDKMMAALAEKAKTATTEEGKKQFENAAILAKCTSARVEAGEADGKVFATIELSMATPEDAENVSLAVQGIRAMVLMQLNSKETEQATELADLLRSIQAGHEGKIFGAAFELPVKTALEKIQKAMEMVAARKAARKAARTTQPVAP